MKSFETTLFIVTLRGTGVFHECSLFRYIKDASDETLNKVKEQIKEHHNLEVYDFSIKFGTLYAFTNRNDVKVFIEEVNPL